MKNDKFYNYPDEVISSVHSWFIWNRNEYLPRDEIKKMEPEVILAYYLEWEGIIGYTRTILNILNTKGRNVHE